MYWIYYERNNWHWTEKEHRNANGDTDGRESNNLTVIDTSGLTEAFKTFLIEKRYFRGVCDSAMRVEG